MAVDVAYDGQEAARNCSSTTYHVVVLDRDLPGLHGDTICQMITQSDNPAMVLMLTAAGTPGDRVVGLGLGADDYLAKPFHFPELVLRVPRTRCVVNLRRLGGSYRGGGIDSTHCATPRPVTANRSNSLSRNSGCWRRCCGAEARVLSAEDLLEQVWDEHADPFTNTVLVTISRLAAQARRATVIETIPSVGYRIAQGVVAP